MSEAFLPFAKPLIGDEEINELLECVRSGWLTTGPRTAKFEEAIAAYVDGGRGALCLSSATAGLHLALLSLDLQDGEEVITTPLTFVCTLNTIVQAGGKPVLVDIDEATFNIDPKKIEAAITPRTRAIVPVHFAGLPCDMDAIYAIAQKHGLRVIEDAAHAIGAAYKGKKIGSFGDTHVFSFHPNKNMTTGEGGAVMTANVETAKFIRVMRFHGIDREAFNRFSKQGSQHYDVILPGFKYNMLDMQAALGLHQLGRLDGFIDARTQQVATYRKELAPLGLRLQQDAPYDVRHAWHLFTLLVPDTLTRDDFIERMKEKNIGIGMHYVAAHLFTLYTKEYGYKSGDFPVAEAVCDRIVSLPLGPTLTNAQQTRVIEAVKALIS